MECSCRWAPRGVRAWPRPTGDPRRARCAVCRSPPAVCRLAPAACQAARAAWCLTREMRRAATAARHEPCAEQRPTRAARHPARARRRAARRYPGVAGSAQPPVRPSPHPPPAAPAAPQTAPTGPPGGFPGVIGSVRIAAAPRRKAPRSARPFGFWPSSAAREIAGGYADQTGSTNNRGSLRACRCRSGR